MSQVPNILFNHDVKESKTTRGFHLSSGFRLALKRGFTNLLQICQSLSESDSQTPFFYFPSIPGMDWNRTGENPNRALIYRLTVRLMIKVINTHPKNCTKRLKFDIYIYMSLLVFRFFKQSEPSCFFFTIRKYIKNLWLKAAIKWSFTNPFESLNPLC